VKNILYERNTIDKKEIMVWEILLLSLKIDALGEPNSGKLLKIKNEAIYHLHELVSIFISYVERNQQKYPSAFLLMYRRLILSNGGPLTDSVRNIPK